MWRLMVVALAAASTAAGCGAITGMRVEMGTDGDPSNGAEIFTARCAACHGVDAVGTDVGPPLVEDVYRSSHHGDEAFMVAVRRGVPQHHWNFGAMPPQPGLSDQDIADIVAYVRQLQREAGIE